MSAAIVPGNVIIVFSEGNYVPVMVFRKVKGDHFGALLLCMKAEYPRRSPHIQYPAPSKIEVAQISVH